MMKRHAIVPIFIAHLGCPNDCVFCNQRRIARAETFRPEDFEAHVETYLETMAEEWVKEIAFFGGSFTGIEPSLQMSFLEKALAYKRRGRIQRIRLSTRPDYLTAADVARLVAYQVDMVEIGCQSFDDDVLKSAGRGHDSAVIVEAVERLKAAGIDVGVQLMVGLPGDSEKTFKASVEAAIALSPQTARLYPTLVVEETALCAAYQLGDYLPMVLEEAVTLVAWAYRRFSEAGVEVIRMGLQKTEAIEMGQSVLAGPFHPAFGELVRGFIYKTLVVENAAEGDVAVGVHPKCLSWLTGHRAFDPPAYAVLRAAERLRFVCDETLPQGVLSVNNVRVE